MKYVPIEDTCGDNISVVIPHYNSSHSLVRALNSVRSQTQAPIETLVVDDCSSQSQREAARAIVNGFSNVKFIELEKNSGPASARNVGWDIAEGEWVAFLDSDDAWHPRKLELQISAARKMPEMPGLVASSIIQLSELDELHQLKVSDSPEVTRITKRMLILRNRMSTPTVLVRKAIPQRFPENRRYSEDYELWMKIAGDGVAVIRVEASLAAIFKAPYGDSGLSSHIWKMILGEFAAYFGAFKAGSINGVDLVVGSVSSAARASIRILRMVVRRLLRLKS